MFFRHQRFFWFLSATILLLGHITSAEAQVPRPAQWAFPSDQLDKVILPHLDNINLQDQARKKAETGGPLKFAEPISVNLSPENSGRWDRLGSLSVWRLRLVSPGAHSLNLGFTTYQMPSEGKLYLYNADQDQINGPYSPADNESHNQLWTPIFPGDEIILEIQIPTRKRKELQLELSYVNHDFLGFGQTNSGSCNLDIVCGVADGWGAVEPFRAASRSVGVYSLGGTLLCTGFLVNNTRKDCRPYFMTANHCKISPDNAASMVVYWNYENSTCREPDSDESGQPGDGQLENFNTGAEWRASWSNSDFALVELDDPVSETANAFFAGWSLADNIPQGTVASVHHPFTDEKRISLSDAPVHQGFWGSSDIAANGNHLIVTQWTTGTTQSGSSGGPLFNANGQVIGQLHGGDAACGNESYDSFGRFFNSWEGGGTPDARLKDWLDPTGLEPLSLEGRDQSRCDLFITGLFSSGDICAGSSDTLQIQIGSGFTSIPELEIIGKGNTSDIEIIDLTDTSSQQINKLFITTENTENGRYTFGIIAVNESPNDTNFITLRVTDQLPGTPNLTFPNDLAEDLGTKILFEWEALAQTDQYQLQLGQDDSFSSPILDENIFDNNRFSPPLLPTNTTYYWRVKGMNTCGEGDWSPAFSFSTADLKCALNVANDGPVNIPSASAGTITSSLEIGQAGKIASIELVDLNIQHRWVGDLSVVLQSPTGKKVTLLDRPGFPGNLFGCDGRDLMLSFNQDVGVGHPVLESTCGSGRPTISGIYQPLESFEILIGDSSQGTWTLIVKDQADEDGGNLIGWGLDICVLPQSIPPLSSVEDAYMTCLDDSLDITVIVGETFTGSEVQLSLQESMLGASVVFFQNPATPGDTIQLRVKGFQGAGIENLKIGATDGETDASLNIEIAVNQKPEAVTLIEPAQGSMLNTFSPTFSWTLADASSYRLEIATDTNFMDVIFTTDLNAATYTFDEIEWKGNFFWRVTALNECGTSISETSGFSLIISPATNLSDNQSIHIFPNPFDQRLNIHLDKALSYPVQLSVLDVNGRLLHSDELKRGNSQKSIELDNLVPGVYFLEMRYRGQRYVERIVSL